MIQEDQLQKDKAAAVPGATMQPRLVQLSARCCTPDAYYVSWRDNVWAPISGRLFGLSVFD